MTIQSAKTPQEEATSLLSEVLTGLTTPPYDLKSIMRKCQHVCELLAWQSRLDWFRQELNGYPSNTQLPSYRRILGTSKWDISTKESSHYRSRWTVEDISSGIDRSIIDEQPDTLYVWANIDWFISASKSGYREELPDQKTYSLSFNRGNVTLHRVRIFSSGSFAACLSLLEAQVFDFASRAYVQLKYGNVITDIWTLYRLKVEEALSKLQLSEHLQSIQSGLQSTNSEDWRSAVFECRSLLSDLANYLWQDPRPTYEYLPGRDTKDGKLDITHGKFSNRLKAYVHQKGLLGTKGEYLRNEVDRLASSIRSLISYQSEAHDPMSLPNARSIAISTYILVGELANRTDLEPIKNYGEPSVPTE